MSVLAGIPQNTHPLVLVLGALIAVLVFLVIFGPALSLRVPLRFRKYLN